MEVKLKNDTALYLREKNKKEITSLAVKMANDDAEAGEIDIIKRVIELTRMNTFVDAYIKQAKKIEIDNYAGTFEAYGATIETGKAVRYDYSNDHEWVELKEKLKAREAILKNAVIMAEKGQSLINDSTGEVVKPAIKKETETLKITLK